MPRVRTVRRWLLIAVAAGLLGSAAIVAPWHSAAAEPEPVAHPVLPISGSVPGGAKLLADYTEEQFTQLVPTSSPRRYDPPSPAGAHGTEWTWDPRHPNVLVDDATGISFPNAEYEPTTASVEVLSGKTVQVPYYETPKGRAFVQARIDHEKRGFLTKSLFSLARAYYATKDERYARRIAVTLDSWADYMPDYFMTDGWNTAKLIGPAQAAAVDWKVQRASDHNGLAHEWGDDEVIAFDAIYDSPTLAELATERGHDVRAHIADDLFANIGDFLVKRVPIETAITSNLSDPYVVLAKAATVLGRPDYVVWLDRYLAPTVDRNFARDGMYPEALGYHIGYAAANLNVAKEIARYFTVWPADTPELAAVKARIADRVAFLTRASKAHCAVAQPNGVLPTFGDTMLDARCPKRTATSSAMLPGFGHATLGNGSGAEQTQLNLSYTDYTNHIRDDVLGMSMYAFGKELLNNNGYVHWPGREYVNTTMSHNTVVVDRTTQDRSAKQLYGNAGHLFTSGDAVLYEPGRDGVGVMEVDGQRSYLGKASRYHRMMLLNTTDPAHPYAVDLFRVTGGRTHDYFLHGAVKFDETAALSFPLEAMAGDRPLLEGNEKWTEPTDQYDDRPWYGVFRNVRTGQSPGSWQATFTEKSPAAGSDAAGVRLSMLDDGSSSVYLSDSPVPLREAKPPAENINNYSRPTLMVRRRAASGTLDSLFTGVIEPFRGSPTITAVESVPLAGEDSEHVALRVRFAGGRVDTWVVDLNSAAVTGRASGEDAVVTADGTIALRGRVGLVSTGADADPARAWSVAAEELRYPGGTLTGTAAYRGTITGTVRPEAGAAESGYALVTDAELPEGTALRGRWLSASFGTYNVVPANGKYPRGMKEQTGISQMFQIDSVRRVDGKTLIYLTEDPALTIADGSATELSRPQRTFAGPTGFEIALSASGTAPTDDPPAPSDPPTPSDPPAPSDPPTPSDPPAPSEPGEPPASPAAGRVGLPMGG